MVKIHCCVDTVFASEYCPKAECSICNFYGKPENSKPFFLPFTASLVTALCLCRAVQFQCISIQFKLL